MIELAYLPPLVTLPITRPARSTSMLPVLSGSRLLVPSMIRPPARNSSEVCLKIRRWAAPTALLTPGRPVTTPNGRAMVVLRCQGRTAAVVCAVADRRLLRPGPHAGHLEHLLGERLDLLGLL